MLVIDAAMWPSGESAESESLGRIAIAQVSMSAGGDYADYVVVHVDGNGQTTEALMLRRRHVMAGWKDLLVGGPRWRGLRTRRDRRPAGRQDRHEATSEHCPAGLISR